MNPELYDYLPSSLLGESYGQILLFLIAFRLIVPAAARWILRRRSSGIFDTRLTPEQILVAAGALWFLLFAIGIYRMEGDVMARGISTRRPRWPDDVGAWCIGNWGERIPDLLRRLHV